MKRLISVLILFAAVSATFSQQNNKADINLQSTRVNNSFSSLNTDYNSESIINIAKNRIHSFIDNIPAENITDYGFKSKAEFDKITFGEPVKIYTLKDGNIEFTDTWRVPVVINNEYRSLLTVIKEKEELKAVDFGACVLAKAISEKKSDKTIGILRVYKIYSDFIIDEDNKILSFIPVKAETREVHDLTYIINLLNK